LRITFFRISRGQHLHNLFSHLSLETFSKRHNIFVTDDLSNAAHIGTYYIGSTAESLCADQRKTFVDARQNEDVDTIHQGRHIF
jgi:hypothetical protein